MKPGPVSPPLLRRFLPTRESCLSLGQERLQGYRVSRSGEEVCTRTREGVVEEEEEEEEEEEGASGWQARLASAPPAKEPGYMAPTRVVAL